MKKRTLFKQAHPPEGFGEALLEEASRIKSLDLARGFTVFMIAPVHTVLLYSDPAIYNTILVKSLAFIAEGPGAQLFMLLMGLNFSFQQQKTYSGILKRVFGLLIAGYLLNLLKFVLPFQLGMLPQDLLQDLQIHNGWRGALQLFLLGDILQFAAIALATIYFVKRIKHYQYVALFFANIIIFASPVLWDCHSTNQTINYLLQLLGGCPPHVFFPVFPWIVYPLLGLSAGYFLKTYGLQVFGWMRNLGLLFLAYGWVLKTFFFKQNNPSFYRTYPADTCLHIGIVFIALYVWQWLHKRVDENYFFRLITYMSENITQVYVIQWLFICWLLPVFGYQQLDYDMSVVVILFTSFSTIMISFGINLLGKNKA